MGREHRPAPSGRMRPLPREFYDRDTALVARGLLGMLLAHRVGGELRVGRVVETEAYLGSHDLASHSSRGRTARTEVMFGPPGFAYVYLIYGMHHCFNIVTEAEGKGAAVLVRALEPVRGIEASASGPGRLCKALGIDRGRNGIDLVGDELFLSAPEQAGPIEVVARPRVGVASAGEGWAAAPLRFSIEGNPFVSRP